MPTNRIFVANCVATRASARSNYGGACQRRKICGSTGRGLTGVVLAMTQYVPLMLTIDAGSHGYLTRRPTAANRSPAQSTIERGERTDPPLRSLRSAVGSSKGTPTVY